MAKSHTEVGPVSLSANLGLLAAIAKGPDDAIRDRLNGQAFDFAGFADFLAKHHLRGYVYSMMADSPARHAFPQEVIDRLRTFTVKQAANRQRLITELKLLAADFSSAGQDFILLKGPYLAKRFYGDLNRRIFWDIDILVRKEDVEQAVRLLARRGFQRRSWILLHSRLTLAFTHALDFAKPGVSLDLHWALRNRPSYNFNYQEIWKTKRAFHLDDTPFYVLSDQYALVLALISIFNDIEVGKIRLRAFIDLRMMVRTINDAVDWSQFLDDRRREHIFTICINVLSLFLRLFDCSHEFPRLAKALAGHQDAVAIIDDSTMERLLDHARVGLRHRIWAARLYDGPRLRFILWWTVSIPFRRATYRAGKSARLKRDLRRLKQAIGLRG